MITVAIVEDDEEIRNVLEILIDRSPGFSCRQVFENCESALEPIQKLQPDVVLMDVELPGIDGIDGILKLKDHLPETDFIMLTIRDDDDTVFRSLAAGATGYLLKDTPPAKLLSSIREVTEGGSPMTPEIARRVTEFFRPKPDSPLSEREREVLYLLCEGHNYQTVANKLFISGHTVRAHIKNIYRKLQVSSRAEAVAKALKNKWA
ncbi:MAG: response regulator [Bacteroidetes bacterium]|nr:response regulator [Bacteroidota bacterium]